jgi:hypothetical protein
MFFTEIQYLQALYLYTTGLTQKTSCLNCNGRLSIGNFRVVSQR